MNLFDYAAAQRLRDIGMEAASSYPNDSWVKQARSTALILAARNGEVTINDVLKVFPPPKDLNPNAIGSVMKTKQLKRIGETISDKVSSHARRIGVYTLCV